jgi:hypothetical protein
MISKGAPPSNGDIDPYVMVRNLWDSISNIYLEPTPPY